MLLIKWPSPHFETVNHNWPFVEMSQGGWKFDWTCLPSKTYYYMYMYMAFSWRWRQSRVSNVRKRTFWHARPTKIQISLRKCAGWSESSVGEFCIAKDAKSLHADNEDWSDRAICAWYAQVDLTVLLGTHVRRVRFLTLRRKYILHIEEMQTNTIILSISTVITQRPVCDPSFRPFYATYHRVWAKKTHLKGQSVRLNSSYFIEKGLTQIVLP